MIPDRNSEEINQLDLAELLCKTNTNYYVSTGIKDFFHNSIIIIIVYLPVSGPAMKIICGREVLDIKSNSLKMHGTLDLTRLPANRYGQLAFQNARG